MMKAAEHYLMPAGLPEGIPFDFVCFGGKPPPPPSSPPCQEMAPWTEVHTNFWVLYAHTGELWFSRSVETTVSSTVADSNLK